MNININQLRAFVTVVEQKSFSSSARSLGLSQPAITLQVQALEAQFGTSLIERRYKNVGLTEAGKALYPRAVRILRDLDEASDEIDRMAKTVSGSLIIGGSTIPGQYLLPKLVGGFRRRYPEVMVRLEIGDTDATLERLESGNVNVAIVGAPAKGRKFSATACASDELILIVPPGKSLPGKARLADLVNEEWVFRERGSGTRRIVEEFLEANGLTVDELTIVMELGTSEAVINAVEQGLGISIVSRWAAEKGLRLGTIQEAKLEGLPLRRTFYLTVTQRARTRATEAFLEYLRSEDAAKLLGGAR